MGKTDSQVWASDMDHNNKLKTHTLWNLINVSLFPMKPYFCCHSELFHCLSLKLCQYSKYFGHSEQFFQEIVMINVFLFSGFHFRGTILEPSLTVIWRKGVDDRLGNKKAWILLCFLINRVNQIQEMCVSTQDVEF